MPIEKNGFVTKTCVRFGSQEREKVLYEQVKQLCKSKLKDIKVVPPEGTNPLSHNAGKAIYNPS